MYFGGKQVVVVVNRNKYVCSVFFEVYRYFKENKAYCFQLTVSYRKWRPTWGELTEFEEL